MKHLIKIVISFFLEKLTIVRGEVNRNDRHGALVKAWGHVYNNHLFGDYVEFGVYKGDSVVSSLKIRRNFNRWFLSQHTSNESWRQEVARQSPLNQPQIFHCLDTFEGMPVNNEGAISFSTGSFLSDLSLVKLKIKKHNRDGIDVRYYKGLFSETRSDFLKSIGGRKIAVANIDCDLEESTRDALISIRDNIGIGTIVLFDDYNCFNADNNKGQRKAFADFAKESRFVFEKFFSYHYGGQAFLINGIK